MKSFGTYKCIFIVSTSLLLGCTEAYELKTQNFESLLVVEATITDEFKTQQIKLSKTFKLENVETNQVNNAQVWIETPNGTRYDFEQAHPGSYTSVDPFQAQTGENYILKVILSDGRSYVSIQETLPAVSELESLSTSLETVNGELGVQIYANSSSEVSDATFFKYDYEETYKIVAPFYHDYDLIMTHLDSLGPLYYELALRLKPQDVKTCYTTKKSTDIVQTSLSDSQNNSVVQFPLRFIKSDDPIMRERYSILVKQSVQSFEAYNFYRILSEIGTIENLFTDNQPGYIQGNMSSTTNQEENVIGFFQVSSVSSKRIYFNYEDFNISRPPYFYECEFFNELDYNDGTDLDGDPADYKIIRALLVNKSHKYVTGFHPLYTFVSAKCGDCTLFSSTVRPEFWED